MVHSSTDIETSGEHGTLMRGGVKALRENGLPENQNQLIDKTRPHVSLLIWFCWNDGIAGVLKY